MAETKEKPIDRWFELGAIAVGLIYYWIEKTPTTLVVTLSLIFALLIHPIWNFWWIEKSLKRRSIALFIFIILLFILGYSWWPSISQTTPITANNKSTSTAISEKEPTITPEIKSLHDLFFTDFNDPASLKMLPQCPIKNNEDRILSEVEYIIWCDDKTKSKFISVYLPESQNTFNAIRLLPTKYKDMLNMSQSLLESAYIHRPEGVETFGDLTFTGRVYIYHETELLPERIETLTQEYEKEGLKPQFRSRSYEIIKNSPLYLGN